jgi:hypothetical protein
MSSPLMMAPASYLQVPRTYCHHFADLRWSSARDAIEFVGNGSTFALTPQVAQFIEGFAAGRRLVHFGYILHLLHLLGMGRRPAPAIAGPLRLAFQEVAQQPGALRNAGAFCAQLCAGVPAVAEPFDRDAARRLWVTTGALLSLVGSAPPLTAPELPPLPPAEFEGKVLQSLQGYMVKDLFHWLRHGTGPINDAGEKLAEAVKVTPPRNLAEVLDRLAERPRLGGAMPFVAQLVSALALPPRRLEHRQLPMGGYSDVTTRGQPEQLLPSQFALDDLEFVRRFAARELLYYRREEPHTRPREELVLLLDQGVRTWGEVRLVLAAAFFALARQAHGRQLAIRVATTSNEGHLIEPLAIDEATLAALLEASDLSENPGLALEAVLRHVLRGIGFQPVMAPDRLEAYPTGSPAGNGEHLARDIVLLTHPRNLLEPDVSAASRLADASTRLFALAVDEHFQAELAEMRHGAPLSVLRFRINRGEPVRPAPAKPQSVGLWSGDVEPIGYPFPFGLSTKIGPFAFDGSGEWLIVSSQHGTIHAFHIDASRTEVLPRGMFRGQVLQEVQAILGVAGGFVVCGRVGADLVVVNYEWAARRCAVLSNGTSAGEPVRWCYRPRFHSVVALGKEVSEGVDLATGERATRGTPKKELRASEACEEVAKYRVPPPDLFIHPTNAGAGELTQTERAVHLNPTNGVITVSTPEYGFKPFTPMSDGQPRLRSCQFVAAQYANGTMATRIWEGPGGAYSIAAFNLLKDGGALVSELKGGPGFSLSTDGRRLAVQTGQSKIAVHDLDGGGRLMETPVGGCHGDVKVELGHDWLSMAVGKRGFLIHWIRSTLTIQTVSRTASGWPLGEVDALSLRREILVRGAYRHQGNLPSFDRNRFIGSTSCGPIVALLDRFGQVSLWDEDGNLLCMFFVFSHLWAWLPDLAAPVRIDVELRGQDLTAATRNSIARRLREVTEAHGKARP